jgi:hypothetical protein
LSGVDANSIVTVGDAGDSDASTYTVKVDAIVGDGTLGLDIASDANITDLVGNPVNSIPTTDQTYTFDHTDTSTTPGSDTEFIPFERAPESDPQVAEETQRENEVLAEAEEVEAASEAEELDESEALFAGPEIIELPQVRTANELDIDRLDGVSREVIRDNSNFDNSEQLKPKHIDIQHLEIRQFETNNLELIKLKKFVPNDSFFESLDELGRDLEEAMDEGMDRTQMSASVTTLAVATGIMTWLLRAGSLLGGFLSVIPLWRHFDPLPVLFQEDKEEDLEVDDEGQTDSDDIVEDLFSQKANKHH